MTTLKPENANTAERNTKIRVGFFDFASCEGCELQIANLEEDILQVVDGVEVVSFREVMKEHSDDYDIAFVEGSINRPIDEERLKVIRSNANILIALGDCATTGSVNKLRNQWSERDALEEVYNGADSQIRGNEYFDVFPTKRLNEVVYVDFYIRGCPVRKEQILYYIKRLAIMPPRTNRDLDFDVKTRLLEVDDRSMVTYDPNKCVLCRRCANICQDILGIDAIGVVSKGNHAIISTPQNIGLEANGCITCGQCVSVCPVGALSTSSSVRKVREHLMSGRELAIAVDSIALASYVEKNAVLAAMPPDEAELQVTSALREAGFSKVVQYDLYLEKSVKMDAEADGNGKPRLASWCMGGLKYVERKHQDDFDVDECASPWKLLLEDFGESVCLLSPCTALKANGGLSYVISSLDLDILLKSMCIDIGFSDPKAGGYDGDTVEELNHPGIAPQDELDAVSLPVGREFRKKLGENYGSGIIEVYPCLRRCLTGGGNHPVVDFCVVEARVEWLESLRGVGD